MNVILTDHPGDVGKQRANTIAHQDCACDCQCACPTDGSPVPVLSLPVAYYLELTPLCNNRCPGCGNVYAAERQVPPFPGKDAAPLDGQGWQTLLARLGKHAHHLKLTGGEPTLHPDFVNIVRAVDTLQIPFTLFTNGRWPQPDVVLGLLQAVETCQGMLVSLHGPDPATHEAFSGVPGSFAETIANLRHAHWAHIYFATSIVITRYNWNQIGQTLDLALALGARHVVCNRFIGAPDADVAPSEAQLRHAIETVESLRRQDRPIRYGNCIPQCFAPSASRGCTAGSTFATIDPWGRMRPCNHAPWIAGDLQTQTIEQIWHGDVMRRWRDMIPAHCLSCTAFAQCHGGCRAQALLAHSSRDPLVREQAIIEKAVSPIVLSLYKKLRPVGKFATNADPKILIDNGRVMVVPAGCETLSSRLDGSLTLEQIERTYGSTAVDWIGALYQQEMVSWDEANHAL